MEQERTKNFSRLSSLPSRPSPAVATDLFSSTPRPPRAVATEPSSSITRPYRLSASTTNGFAPSAVKPSALLQRRVNATQCLSEVKASHSEGPPPPPPPLPPSRKAPTAYEILEISRSASQQEIRTAYGRLARQHHPDKAPLDRKEASSVLFLQIKSAYEALKEPEARARYDRQKSLQSSQSLSADVRTPHFCCPSANVFTPGSQLYPTKAAMGVPNPHTPRSQLYTPTGATADSSHDAATPHTPFSAGRRSWETDQCW